MDRVAPAWGLDRTFEAVVLDWERTGLPGGSAVGVGHRVSALSAAGVDVAVVSRAGAADVDGQLRARPPGPGRLLLYVDEGRECYEVGREGPRLLHQRAVRRDPVPAGRRSSQGRESHWAGTSLLAEGAAGNCAEAQHPATGMPQDTGLVDARASGDGADGRAGLAGRLDLMRSILAGLAERGIGPGLVLVIGYDLGRWSAVRRDDQLPAAGLTRLCAVSVGDDPAAVPYGVRHLGGGPAMLLRLLDEQLRRRRHGRVPAVDEDPAWTVGEAGRDPLRHRVTESLFTLGAGGFATRGSVEEEPAGSVPLVLASGVYTGTGEDQRLLPGPDWTALSIQPPPAEDRRVLDVRTGLLWREEAGVPAPVRSLRFASAARPGVVALRAEGAAGRLPGGPPLQPPVDGGMEAGLLGDRWWARVPVGDAASDPARAGSGAPGVAAVAAERRGRDAGIQTVERVAVYQAGSTGPPAPDDMVGALDAAVSAGFDRLLAEHRAAWKARWDAVDVSIPGDPAAELALRFALFQLWANVGEGDEAAVGARGLSGTGYAGHVFWDADVFVLPAVVSMAPAVARAMIEYRLRRLPAAQANARAAGYAGARFPWESAADGSDVTPAWGYIGAERVPILTGRLEDHVTADVAWAACHYAAWASDQGFLAGPARALLTETARFWASRCRLDEHARAHIEDVIGPDEYHEAVNDNAYTNVMARWNLRRAADLVDGASPASEETRRWRAVADRLVDGYEPATGRYEQFAGFFGLDPLVVAEVATPPVAADVLLGRDRVAASQLIKQADVLMLHHLVPEEVVPGSLGPNLDFYGPRTTHGSSLSPAVMAALLARAGRPDEALSLLRVALRLDLDDLTGMTATGLHMATFGGVWQAMLGGFAGVRVRDGLMQMDPVLPMSWPSLGLRFHCLGRAVRLGITRDRVEIWADAPLRVQLAGHRPQTVRGRARLVRRAGRD